MITFFIFVLSLSGLVLNAHAQTFESYVSLALQHNPEIKAAHAAIQNRVFSNRSAYSGLFPQVSGALTYAYRDPSFPGNESSYLGSINVSQNIYRGGQDFLLIEQRKQEETLEVLALQNILVNLSFDLQQAFADYFFAKDSLVLSEKIIKRRKDNFDLIELQYQGGRENKGSVALAAAYLGSAEFGKVQAQNTLRVTQALLARIVGVSPEKLPALEQREIDFDSPTYDRSTWLPSHPRVRSVQTQVELANIQKKQAVSRFLPSLDFSLSYGLNENSFFPTQDFLNLSLGLSVPIFRGGQNYYGLKSSEQAILTQSWTLQNLSNQLTYELSFAERDLQESHLKLKVDDQFQTAAQLRAEISRIRYNNGLVSFDNWDIIENDLISRQTVLLQSKRAVLYRKAALVKSLGKHVFE